ncbi:hypothetical protein BDV93DRAFT_512267 [Ceratobasidium sp. AG-I]|nr:hypothetical protein BDV93DRAFT_512267 [Ceratobasidium sp. AG-I]
MSTNVEYEEKSQNCVIEWRAASYDFSILFRHISLGARASIKRARVGGLERGTVETTRIDGCRALRPGRLQREFGSGARLVKVDSANQARAGAELPLKSARPKRAASIYACGLDCAALQTSDSGAFDRSSRAQTNMSE